jgi:hypothetical protein
VSHRARWKIDNENKCQSNRDARWSEVEGADRRRGRRRGKEEEEEEEEAMHIFIPTHPALKHFQQKFSRNTPNILNKTLLIVTRKGGGNIRQG